MHSSPSSSRIIITGASGLLGSAICDGFDGTVPTSCSITSSHHHRFDHEVQTDHLPDIGNPLLLSGNKCAIRRIQILALSHTRLGNGLLQLDLTHKAEVERVFSEFKPNWVIHCAAERRPDVVQKDPARATELNVEVPRHLAQLSASLSFKLVYISTDYVFDGTSSPYYPKSPTGPLQQYGQSKLDGEQAALGVPGASVVVLRLPVLYGPTPRNSDSAINILLDIVRDQSGKKHEMDHWATRYPTNVCDVARFLVRLLEKYDTKGPDISLPGLPTIMHYSANEPYTKYEICLLFAQMIGLPHTHIFPVCPDVGHEDLSEVSYGVGCTQNKTITTSRPKDCRLDTTETEELCSILGIEDPGEGGPLGLCLFEEWWSAYVKLP